MPAPFALCEDVNAIHVLEFRHFNTKVSSEPVLSQLVNSPLAIFCAASSTVIAAG